MSYVAAVFTLFLLATPSPAPSLKMGLGLVLALTLPVVIGSYALLPFFVHLHSVGVVLVLLALLHTFHFTARGGPAVVGTILTIGITLNVAVGSVSVDAVSSVTTGIAFGAVVGIIFVWLAHALLPDPPQHRNAVSSRPATSIPPKHVARLRALRSFVVVAPIAIWFLFSASSASLAVIMIKVAAMGQEAESAGTRRAAGSLLASTVWGGLGAVVAWQLLSVWPSLFFYTLIVLIAALLYGRRIFADEGLAKDGPMWSYAFLTFVILLAPAVLDSMGGSPAGAAFWSRLTLVGIASVYGSVAVAVFDTIWPAQTPVVTTSGQQRRPA
jgi:hypothetical protein